MLLLLQARWERAQRALHACGVHIDAWRLLHAWRAA